MEAFQWCQSGDTLFLNVKFSHKLDAPATLNVETTKVEITEKKLILHASNGAFFVVCEDFKCYARTHELCHDCLFLLSLLRGEGISVICILLYRFEGVCHTLLSLTMAH